MGGGARGPSHLVGKSTSPSQQNGKTKRNPRWTNTAEVACSGKWLSVKEYVRKNGNPQAALPLGARVKCWGFALGQPGFLKVFGPEGVTKGRVIARGKTIIESLQTDVEFRAMRSAHSESAQMSGTIEVVVVKRKDIKRHIEKKAAEMIARVLILNLNRIRLVWSKMWVPVGKHLVAAATASGSASHALYAVDSLRQLTAVLLSRDSRE